MKKAIAILMSLLLMISFNSFAGNKAEKKADKMARILKLNRSEKAKVLAIYKKSGDAKSKIKANKKLSPEEKKQQLAQIKVSQKTELKAVIGDARYDKYKNDKNKDKRNHKKQ